MSKLSLEDGNSRHAIACSRIPSCGSMLAFGNPTPYERRPLIAEIVLDTCAFIEHNLQTDGVLVAPEKHSRNCPTSDALGLCIWRLLPSIDHGDVVSMLTISVPPFLFEHSENDKVPELPVEPQEVSLCPFKLEAKPLVQSQCTLIITKSRDLDSMQSSISKAPVQRPFDRLRSESLTLIPSDDVNADLAMSMMDHPRINRSKVDLSNGYWRVVAR